MAGQVTSPQRFFGFEMGADRKLAHWDRLVAYYRQLEAESERLKVVELGKTTDGNPFLLVIISAPSNLTRLERLREVNLKLADPRGLGEAEVEALVAEGRAVVCQSMSLHATEVGGTQMAPELAYDLLTRDDDESKRILDNVVFLMVPCFNPDGQMMVADWYQRWLGTEYEGSTLPWLYHRYTGHDNNRDAFLLNIPESRHMAGVLFREWKPQAYQDHHHMGSYGPRLYVAPYCDPIHPHADPLIWREHAWFGGHMALKLEEAGKTGIINAAQFPGWGHLGFHWITIYHNIAGMLTESAGAKLATPLYIHPSQLEGFSAKTMPAYEAQTNFPHPWPGGWWRLRDIVEQQKIAAWALLDLAARHRETVLRNAVLKARRQTTRGETGKPAAFAIRACQHDWLTVRKLVQLLLNQGLEVHVAAERFEADGKAYPEGTFVVFLAQPKMGLVRTLLGRTLHPDNYWTRTPDGAPAVFDTATDTVAEFMGVSAEPLDRRPEGWFEVLRELPPAEARPTVAAAPGGWVLDCRLNDSFRAVNRLLGGGCVVWRLGTAVAAAAPGQAGVAPGQAGVVPGQGTADGCELPAGSFYVEPAAGAEAALAGAVRDLGLHPAGLSAALAGVPKHLVKQQRVGIYQRYWGGNMDEGWTRFVLDQFEFPHAPVMDADLRSGNLRERFDVLILPHDRKQVLVDPTKGDPSDPMMAMFRRYMGAAVPPEYKSGMGEAGVKALKDFVVAGGRLVALGQASELAIEALGLNVRNVVARLDPKAYYCRGSTLRVELDRAHLLTTGLPAEALAFCWDSPVFEITETFRAEDYAVVARYPQRDVLCSGKLVGEDKIAGRAAMVTARCGQGRVALIGLRCQHRGQTHGTFKLLFNCLL